MINKNIIKALLNGANKENKDIIINELLNHISLNYDYNDNKAGHVLEMLVDSKAVVRKEDIDVSYISKNLNLLVCHPCDYNIRNINVVSVDNIDCNARIEFEYMEKINEDRDDIDYNRNGAYLNFIDIPDILKNKC